MFTYASELNIGSCFSFTCASAKNLFEADDPRHSLLNLGWQTPAIYKAGRQSTHSRFGRPLDSSGRSTSIINQEIADVYIETKGFKCTDSR